MAITPVDAEREIADGRRPPSLWRNRAFNLLWGSQALSALGTSMSSLAMPLLTLGITGTPPVLIGAVEAMIAVGLLAGALLAPTLSRKVPLRLLVMGICWIGVAVIAAGALLTESILLGVPMAVAIALGPVCNAALFGYQAAVTPDRLQGRVVSVIFMVATSLSSVASLLGGAFVHWWGGPATVLAFAGIMAVSAVTATVSKGVRGMRPLSEVAQPARP